MTTSLDGETRDGRDADACTSSDGAVSVSSELDAALVHDWVTQWGGPESVLLSLRRVLGDPSLHMGVWDPDDRSQEAFGDADVRTSWLQRIPGANRHYRWLLPLMPKAFETLPLGDAELVVSSSHGFAKAVTVPPDAVHICYCHTPPRYLWDEIVVYNRGPLGALRRPALRLLRRQDLRAAARVDHFVANSRHVAGRIRRYYGREARVIYPPVDVERYNEVDRRPGDYYLAGGRLSRYKRIDSAVRAANQAEVPLKVFGDGPEYRRLKALAGPTVELLGQVSDEELLELMAGARAYLHPGKEDFGIQPVEAQAAGCPVVAWASGGARETVVHGKTGVLYDDPTPLGILDGLRTLEQETWRPELARGNARRFNRRRFEEEMAEEVDRVLRGHRLDQGRPVVQVDVKAQLNGPLPPLVPANGEGTGGDGSVRPRRNLVTGGAGFIGSHLAEALLAQGEEVVVLDDLSTGHRTNITHLLPNPRFHFFRGRVTDRDLVEERVRDTDRVFHMAAAVGVKLVMERPVDTVMTNVRGTGVVLEMAAQYGRQLLMASTSEVYGKAMETGSDGPRLLSETDDWTLGPTSKRRWAYACSKAMDEFLALAYRDDMDLPMVVVRFFNTVGPRQTGRYGMVVPNFVASALKGRPIVVHGDGEQTRCFTHVADSVRAVLQLMDTPEAQGEVVNIGNSHEVSINKLAQRVRAKTGSSSEIRRIPYEEAYGPGFEDMRRRTPDASKLKRLVGYEPRHDLERILDDVIAYQEGRWTPTPFESTLHGLAQAPVGSETSE